MTITTEFFARSVLLPRLRPLMLVMLFQTLPGIAFATSRIELPRASATPSAVSVKDLAEKEVASPSGAIDNTGDEVIFPDFSPGTAGGDRDSLDGVAHKSTSGICRRAGNSYKAGDVMYASCKSQNDVERGQTRSQMGTSHGKFSGSNTGAGARTL